MKVTKKISFTNEEINAMNVISDIHCADIYCSDCPFKHELGCVSGFIRGILENYNKNGGVENDY